MDEGSKEGFAALAQVMGQLEERQIQGKLLLRDAAMGAQPTTQQRPNPFHRIDVYFVEAITIFIARLFAPAMAHRAMHIPPLRQACVDVVLIGEHGGPGCNHLLNQRLDSDLSNIAQHTHDDLAPTLNHAENRWFLLLKRASPPRALETPTPPRTGFFLPPLGGLYGPRPRKPRRIRLHRSASPVLGDQQCLGAAVWSSRALASWTAPVPHRSGGWTNSTP